MRTLVLIASLLAVSPAAFADRFIWVNGKRMAPAEIAYLERLRCGPIPDGRYWLDVGSGIWGYANNPRPQGHISDNCYRAPSGGGGGQAMNRRGPFGDYMSDGQCSFVNGVPVGRC
jgi:hypothetical protein